jgi:hypothetical protein
MQVSENKAGTFNALQIIHRAMLLEIMLLPGISENKIN